MKNLRSISIAAFFMILVGFISCSKEEAQKGIIQDDLSNPLKKLELIKGNYFNSEPTEITDGFELRNLAPEQELIYQRSLSEVREQFSSLKSARKKNQFEVYPTGIWPDDLIYLQTLVNELGNAGKDAQILLKATNVEGEPTLFNFGLYTNPGTSGAWVVISPNMDRSGSIDFIGERIGDVITTVSGGVRYASLEGGSFFIHDRPDDDFMFKDIRFINEGGIELASIKSLKATECIFENTTIGIDNFGVYRFTRINNNVFSNVGASMRIWNSQPQTTIFDNKINIRVGYYGSGIVIGDITGTCSVHDNIIYSAPETYSNGIEVISIPEDGAVHITDNRIHMVSPWDWGIALYSWENSLNHVLLEDNFIEVNSNSAWSSSIIIADFGYPLDDICVVNNRIKGMASSAIWISGNEGFGYPVSSEISNVYIHDNNLLNFVSNGQEIDGSTGLGLGYVDIFLGSVTHDITVCDQKGIVIDYGTNNIISEEDCPKGRN